MSQLRVHQLRVCQFEDGCSRPGPVPRPGFRWMVLQRHGRRPLAVLGRTLLYGDNRCAGLPWWSSVTLHETEASRFAVALRHVAADGMDTAAGSAAMVWHDTQLHDSAASLRTALGRHDPLHALPVGAMAQDPGGCWMPPDIAAAWRFRTAWSGLLHVLFGAPADAMALQAAPAE